MQLPCAKSMARVFDYPGERYLSQLDALERECRRIAPLAAEQIVEMLAQLEGKSLPALRELYTRTFDLTPVCAPYLSVHLFGEGNYKRSTLMTGLAEQYEARGLHPPDELPDHLGIVLGAIDHLDEVVQRDLLVHCFRKGLERMLAELERQSNPYSRAVSALDRLVRIWISQLEVTRD
ncbi:MAG TPA: molecular chaperone TorD family protein [Polyangiaceae bacterium]|nr:molecular chaperone TorD family protein [Polyangiaceae bacterium]